MRMLRKPVGSTVVTLAAVFVCLGASPSESQAAQDVAGLWNSNYGDVTFYQDDQVVKAIVDGPLGNVYLVGSFTSELRLRLWVKGQTATGWANLWVSSSGDQIKGYIRFDGHSIPVRWKLWR